ncbi:MAG TPA: dipeptidase PepE [Rhodothermales bacterium]|nr:dipeptidase PepE [Rhodothermales bacterium]
MRLLLLSNSTNPGGSFLGHAEGAIRDFLGGALRRVLFVPFAGVRISYADYTARVREKFEGLGYGVDSLHAAEDRIRAVREAEAVVIGGGNTFHLVHALYEGGVIDAIRERVRTGAPYVGWSAGSNVACPTLRTTNDMPIVEPPSFRTLDLVPFQINPHYVDARTEGHGGETRDERIAEFIEVNPGVHVVGLREGTYLRIEGDEIELAGEHSARVFLHGRESFEVAPGEDVRFLLG